jgi:hypothetical protein
MLSPFVFLVMVAPLAMFRADSWTYRLAFVFLVGSQLSLGIARPIATSRGTGSAYRLPYPGDQDVALRFRYEWDVRAYARQTAPCRHVALDIDNRFIERVLAIYLTDARKPWESTHPDRERLTDPDTGRVIPIGPDVDCVLTSNPRPLAGATVISVLADDSVPTARAASRPGAFSATIRALTRRENAWRAASPDSTRSTTSTYGI